MGSSPKNHFLGKWPRSQVEDWGPLALRVKVPFSTNWGPIWRCQLRSHVALRVEVPFSASQGPLRRDRKPRSHVAPRAEVPGDKIKPKHFEFWAFVDHTGQSQLYHIYLQSKIWNFPKLICLWRIPVTVQNKLKVKILDHYLCVCKFTFIAVKLARKKVKIQIWPESVLVQSIFVLHKFCCTGGDLIPQQSRQRRKEEGKATLWQNLPIDISPYTSGVQWSTLE